MRDGVARQRPRRGRLALLLAFSATAAAAAKTHSFTAVTLRSSTGDVAIPIPPTGSSGITDVFLYGLLMLRWLFGFRGSVLIADVVAAHCTRCTAGQIEAFLQALDPL